MFAPLGLPINAKANQLDVNFAKSKTVSHFAFNYGIMKDADNVNATLRTGPRTTHVVFAG